MDIKFALGSVLMMGLIGCGSGSSSGDGGTPTPIIPDNSTNTYAMPTGFVTARPMYDSSGRVTEYVYKHPDGDIKLVFSGRPTDVRLLYDADVEIDGEIYDGASAYVFGYGNMGGMTAVGYDGNDDPFAVASFKDDARDSNDFQPLYDNMGQVDFYDVGYAYSFVKDDEIVSVTGDSGTIIADAGGIYGNFGGGELTVSAELRGIDMHNGRSELYLDGQTYPGQLEGVVFFDPDRFQSYTFGAFVSSDPTDEVLYSGGFVAEQ